MEFIKSNPGYSNDDVQKMQNCIKEKANRRRQSLEIWEEDKKLPGGWRSRTIDGKNIKIIFLTPNGAQFTCGRTALLNMIQEKYDDKETSSENNTAIEELLNSKRFDEDDVSKVKELMAEKRTLRRQTLESWEDDKNLPDGWRFRIAEGVRGVMFFLAPDGKQFQTRRAAYQHLITEKYNAKDIEIMKGLLIAFEKWQEHSKLPQGWIFKEASANTKEKNKTRVDTTFSHLKATILREAIKP
jgi:uncharacterized protein YbdZ (MbtH family)